MKIEFWYIGKTTEQYVKLGEELFNKRLKHYTKLSTITFPKQKNNYNPQTLKDAEQDALLRKINNRDFIVLLDEKGKEMKSTGFAVWLNNRLIDSSSRLIFIIGGAYGFGDKIRSRANFSLALSKMTFPHQLIRVIFLEQLYRGFTILRNEKYHNE